MISSVISDEDLWKARDSKRYSLKEKKAIMKELVRRSNMRTKSGFPGL